MGSVANAKRSSQERLYYESERHTPVKLSVWDDVTPVVDQEVVHPVIG